MFTINKYKNKRILVQYEGDITTKIKNKYSKQFKPFGSRWSSQNNGWLIPSEHKEDIQHLLSENMDSNSVSKPKRQRKEHSETDDERETAFYENFEKSQLEYYNDDGKDEEDSEPYKRAIKYGKSRDNSPKKRKKKEPKKNDSESENDSLVSRKRVESDVDVTPVKRKKNTPQNKVVRKAKETTPDTRENKNQKREQIHRQSRIENISDQRRESESEDESRSVYSRKSQRDESRNRKTPNDHLVYTSSIRDSKKHGNERVQRDDSHNSRQRYRNDDIRDKSVEPRRRNHDDDDEDQHVEPKRKREDRVVESRRKNRDDEEDRVVESRHKNRDEDRVESRHKNRDESRRRNRDEDDEDRLVESRRRNRDEDDEDRLVESRRKNRDEPRRRNQQDEDRTVQSNYRHVQRTVSDDEDEPVKKVVSKEAKYREPKKYSPKKYVDATSFLDRIKQLNKQNRS